MRRAVFFDSLLACCPRILAYPPDWGDGQSRAGDPCAPLSSIVPTAADASCPALTEGVRALPQDPHPRPNPARADGRDVACMHARVLRSGSFDGGSSTDTFNQGAVSDRGCAGPCGGKPEANIAAPTYRV